jgi:hypothetical protein
LSASSNIGLSTLPELAEHLVAHLADDLRARVEVLVDAVAEAHQAHAGILVLHPVEELRHLVHAADLLEHVEHGLVGAAVGRAPQRRHARRNGGVGIAAGAAGEAHRRGAGILLVVGVQDEQQVERLGVQRIDLVGLAGDREEHVQHVRGVVEVVARVHEGLAERVLVGCRGDRRQLGDDAVREDLAVPRVIDVGGVVVEGRHRRHDRGHHGHRVGVVMEAVVHVAQRLVEHRVPADRPREAGELRRGRQVAVQQQVGHLEVAAVLGELLDRVAAVEQDAGIAIDVGDAALAGCGGHEPGIEGEHPVVTVEGADVDHLRAYTAGVNRVLGGLAGGEVLQLEFVLAHVFSSRFRA